MVNFRRTENIFPIVDEFVIPTILIDSMTNFSAEGVYIGNKYTSRLLHFVPLSLNYDLNNFLGVGIGVQGTLEWGHHNCKTIYRITNAFQEDIAEGTILEFPATCQEAEDFTVIGIDNDFPTTVNFGPAEEIFILKQDFTPSVYGDFRLGSVRSGPTLGGRFLYSFIKSNGFQELTFADKANIQLYLLVKF